jgi:uncharacterized protein (TIGR02996 family)
MDLEQALLASIRDEPGDESNWLILADWLDDRGDSGRAELLRLSVGLRRDLDGPDRPTQEQRLRDLLTRGVRPCLVSQSIPLTSNVALQMVLVPPGFFRMGSPPREKGRDTTEGPMHRVRLTRPFWIGVYPVTQQQWQAVMGHNPARFRGAERPVENVSWQDSIDCCVKLGRRTGHRFRLPTEAEWEYCCRAGTTTPYHSGEGLGALERVGWCNYQAQWYTATETKPVGRFIPNAFGLHDTHGNVWEWCSDWFGPYLPDDATDPTGPASGTGRVVRGGSWYFAPRICRSAYRFYYSADLRTDSHGCRVIMEYDE